MVTTLYLVRHGETEGAEVRRYKGSIDVPLSKNGVEQMRRVSALISTEAQKRGSAKEKFSDTTSELLNFRTSALSAVYCSDLSRAIKSAEIIAESHGLSPVIIPKLRERNFGIWEGMSFDEIREKYPAEFESWAKNPLKYSPVGGESTIELRDRVIKAMEEILSNHIIEGQGAGNTERIQDARYGMQDGKNHESCIAHHAPFNIVIVSHGGVNRIILCHFLGIPLENIFRIEQDYAAVNIIELWDKYPVIKLINHIVNTKPEKEP